MQDLTYFLPIYGIVAARIFLIGLLYLIPFWVAAGRGHPHKTPILILNLLLGWTVFGWIGALIWAFVRPASEARIHDLAASPPR
ncbi:superinfection immunity protein [Caulobacter hibisci]|uniref:superinfection immunity protein n=1 Tax=Caulobacter hibisci TaxID=2035993 RepID=UPI002FCDA34D